MDLDNLQFENDEERRRYLVQLAKLKKYREEADSRDMSVPNQGSSMPGRDYGGQYPEQYLGQYAGVNQEPYPGQYAGMNQNPYPGQYAGMNQNPYPGQYAGMNQEPYPGPYAADDLYAPDYEDFRATGAAGAFSSAGESYDYDRIARERAELRRRERELEERERRFLDEREQYLKDRQRRQRSDNRAFANDDRRSDRRRELQEEWDRQDVRRDRASRAERRAERERENSRRSRPHDREESGYRSRRLYDMEQDNDENLDYYDEEKPKKKSHVLLIILLILLLALIGFFAFHYFTKSEGHYTVAVFGLDSRDGNLGKDALSDVNIIADLDMDTGEIKLVSIYRDTYVQINSEGKYHKFNEAYFRGGPEQALWTIEHNLDIKCDDYAAFNWKAVVDTINILGGVDIEITDPEFAYINGFITETVNSTGVGSYQLEHAGMNHLDGVQAVAYARLRLMDTDFQRTQRQRKVISLAFEKAKHADFATLNCIMETVLPQINTSVTLNDMIPFAKNISKLHLAETAGFPFEKKTADIGKLDAVVAVTLESNAVALHKFLWPDEEYTPSKRLVSISDKIIGETGLGATGKTEVKVDNLDKPVGDTGSSSSGSSGASSDAQPQEAEVRTEQPEQQLEQETEAVNQDGSEVDTPPAESEQQTDSPTMAAPDPLGGSARESVRESETGTETEESESEKETETEASGTGEADNGTPPPGDAEIIPEPEFGPGNVSEGDIEQ